MTVGTASDKDLPLKEDTRLLGRVLGDVVRAQTGAAGFERVEAIRQTAIRFRRAGSDEAPALRAELEALVIPVLTAHPTEVQRKSILDAEREIARLLGWRDRVALTPEESHEFDTALYRQVLGLWQTAMLRLSKLRVRDEIDNGLAYYRYTFLDQIPKLYADLGEHLTRDFAIDGETIPPFLRTGSWIGGDRDG